MITASRGLVRLAWTLRSAFALPRTVGNEGRTVYSTQHTVRSSVLGILELDQERFF
jgi:hypothetical protein